MRRESVSSLRVRNLASGWGLRGVVVKGGKTRDIPLPDVVVQVLNINEIELVAPTGFGSQASLFEIAFEGLALAA